MTLPLYTKTGDRGKTSVLDGKRVSKGDILFDLLGSADELNSFLGHAVVLSSGEIRDELKKIQYLLFDFGAFVAGASDASLSLNLKQVVWLERKIDEYQRRIAGEWYQTFLLPGGSELAARIDIARSACRRVERVLIKASKKYSFERHDVLLAFINRLSDYFFALRCVVNGEMAVIEEKVRERDF